MSQDIENYFEKQKKAGTAFIDLAAAHDTIWHLDLVCKNPLQFLTIVLDLK